MVFAGRYRQSRCLVRIAMAVFAFSVAALSPLVAQSPVPAQDSAPRWFGDFRPTDLLIRDTYQVIINADAAHANDSAPSPIINMLGLSVVFPVLGQSVFFSPQLDFYAQLYTLVDGRALPAEEEYRTAWVAGAILDLPAYYQWIFAKSHRLTAGAGLALVARCGFLASQVPAEEQPAIDSINSWLWDKGRFFYPEVNLSYSYQMASWLRVGARFRLMVPVFNLWTGEGLPFTDNMIVGGGIFISFTGIFSGKSSK